MLRIVIADASTIIGLLNVQHLSILKSLYNTVYITSIVKAEVSTELPAWIKVGDDYDLNIYRSLENKLDKGEASSIALAIGKNDCLLIIDEKKGRAEAKQLGIAITGVVGVIMRAKSEGVITSGKKALENLLKVGFRISDKIYGLALDQMGES